MKFFRCICGAEGISVERDTDSGGVEYWISLWRYGSGTPLSWRDRLRYCWQILWHGKPYADAVCLTEGDASELAQYMVANENDGR